MVIPKKVRRVVPYLKEDFPPAVMDVYSEQGSDEVDVVLKVRDFVCHDPKEIRKLAKYLIKCAEFLEECEKHGS